jgi:membrane fusion protein, multidrug efflux system
MKSKNIRNIAIIVFALVILGIVTISRLSSNKDADSKRSQTRSGAAIAVNVKVVEVSTFQNKIQVSGSVISNEEVVLHTETSGKIISINFKEGQKVNKGTLLVKVNDADLQAQLQKAEIKMKLAEDKEYRQRVLLGKKGVSQEVYDSVLNDLNSAKADIDNIKAQIAKTEIRAPFNGTIGLRYVSEGSYIDPTVKIATLQDLSQVKIDFAVPQRYASAISVRSKVTIRASSGKEYPVKIYALEQKIDPDTRSLNVRAIHANAKGDLVPGSYVTVDIDLNDINNAVVIPTQALALDITGETVYLYKGGIAVSQKVESGIRSESDVQIVKGLSVGDTVITSGIMQLRPKLKVKIMSSDQNKN